MSNQVSASPMEIFVRLDCVGFVDETKFADAILAELKLQPLLQANATVGPTHLKSHWRPASNCVPDIRWFAGDPDNDSGLPSDFAPIDLENEIGFRFYGWRFLVDDQQRIVMKFVYHHACCDGKSGVEFAEKTFHRYQCLLAEQAASLDDELAVADEYRVRNRARLTAKKLSPIDRIWRTLVIRPKRIGSMLLSKPRVFPKPTENANGGVCDVFSDLPQLCTTQFNRDQTRQLGVLSKKLSATTNTILAGQLFHVLNDHFESNVETPATVAERNKRNLCILLPFSLRDQGYQSMPVANCVSMAYLAASGKILKADRPDDPVLVADLARQVKFIRRWNLQYSWIESINTYVRIWPIFRLLKFVRKGRSMQIAPTTVMTNLGRVMSDSDLATNSDGERMVNGSGPKGFVVKSVHVSPPCAATVIVNFSINFYGDRLTLDVTYLPSFLDRKTAEGLLGSWRQRVIDSVTGLTTEG